MVRLIKIVLLALLGFAALSVAGQAFAAVTVTNVTSSTADGNIRQNGVVSIQVTFSAAVYVTAPTASDKPELSLNVITAGRAATYTSGSGTSVLTFTFTAIVGDNSDDLDYTSTTALTNKGVGTIKDAGGNDAVLTVPAPGSAGSLGFNKNFVVDVVSGYPLSVTSTTPDGRYTVGADIYVQVNFSESLWFKSGVTTAATSRLKLETGDIDRYATYVSGSGSSTFTFKYTVQSGDTSSDLNLFDRASLEGSLQDRVTNTANLTLPPLTAAASLAGSKAIVIDTTAPVVTSVTSVTADGVYKVGSVISLRVNFSEAVNVTGTPQLTLETGATDRVINIDTVSGSGTTTLNFSYTVGAGDSALDLDYASTTSLVGTISDLATNAATLTLPAPGAAGSLGANKAIWIDTTGPMVTSVSSSKVDGSYKVGSVITLQVSFSEGVIVLGTPQLTLNLGATTRAVNYTSGTGSGILTFTYTVQVGDTSADLDYVSTTSLVGMIVDLATNAATLTLPAPGAAGSLGANKAIAVDGVVPVVTSVTSVTADGAYKVGSVISLKVNFNEAVIVTGTPQLTLETGATDRAVNYVSGSGTSALTFNYTVHAEDTNTDLDYAASSSMALNGGTINDPAGNAGVLTLPAPGAAGSLGANKAIVIDTTAPVVTSVTSVTADGAYKVGSVISLKVNFSEAVIVTGTPQLTLETGAIDRAVNYVSGSGTSALTFNYTVQDGDTNADLDYAASGSLALNGGTITDPAGNAGPLTLPAPGAAGSLGANKSIAVDGVVPVVTSVTSSSTNGAYKLGDLVSVQVSLSEPVIITGTPQLTLETGAVDQAASYVSGSGTATLTFNYTVQAGDSASDLDYTSTTALALNAGTITDSAGNAATLTLPAPGEAGSLGASKAIAVDGAVPTITSVTVPANGTYHLGQSLDVSVNVSEPVTVVGNPSIAVTIGSTARSATYLSGSDSTTLLFRYTVQTGDLDTDGIDVLALAANGATLQDAAGNALTVALFSVGSTLGVLVDAVAPTLTGLSPNSGTILGGTTVTLTGSGFSELSAVKFGAVSATSYTVESSTKITALAPNGALGAVNVTVTTPNGTSAAGAGTQFTYFTVPDAPTIDMVTAGDAQASVSFSAPASDGGVGIAGYAVTSSPEGIVATGSASPIVVTGLTNGVSYTFTVTASNAAGTGAESAASNSVTPVASQSITFENPGAQSFGASPTLTATATSGLAVSFTATTAEVCSVTSDGALTFAAAGTCTIDADQAGDARYSAAPTVSQSFEVAPIAPDAPTIGTVTAGDAQASVSFSAPARSGGAAITGYRVTASPGGATATGSASPIVVTGLTNGVSYTFTVTASNAAGTGAASAASNAVTPVASQSITFENPGAQSFATSPTLTATASSGLTVSFTATPPEVCSVTSDGALTFAAAGTCTIDADQAGDARYTAAPTVSQSFEVAPIAPDAPTIGAVTAGDAQASVSFSAPASDGGAAIAEYAVTSSPEGIVATGSASPIVVTGLTNGVSYTFTVTASNAAGTGVASAASNAVTPVASQSITFDNPGTQSFGASPTLTATASSGLTVSFTATPPKVCSVTSDGVLTFAAAGTCTIDADQAGDARYSAAPTVSQSFEVAPIAPDAPTIGAAEAGAGQASVSFSAPASDGGAEITGYTVTSSPEGIVATGSASPIVVTGLTNGVSYTFTVTARNAGGEQTDSAPSPAVTPTVASPPPTADAGDPQIVESGAEVTLDGMGSSDPDDPILACRWTQTAGTSVDLSNEAVPQPTFIAPVLDVGAEPITLVFALTVYDRTLQSAADTVSVTVQPPDATPASAFAQKADAIRQTLTDTTLHHMSGSLAANQAMVQDAKERFVSRDDQAMALDVDGSFTANPVGLSTMGTFYGQTVREDGARRLIFGAFDVQRDDDGGSKTATFSGKIAFERAVSQDTLLGYFIGGDVAHSTLKGSFAGGQDHLRLSLGGYAVHQMADQVYLDGFVSVSAGRDSVTMHDNDLALEGDYTTRGASFGAALSGVIAAQGYEIRPELGLTAARTWGDPVGFTGTANAMTDDSLSLDTGQISVINLTFRPEVRVALGGGSVAKSQHLLTFAPRLLCQKTNHTKACGHGIEFGLQSRSADGHGSFRAEILSDWIDGQRRTSGRMSFEWQF